MANASQVASAGVYVTDDIGLEVTDGSNSRVQLGLLPSGTYGLRVVAANGTTVIIDGTSDQFKIAATGSMQVTGANGTTPTTDVTLTALGTWSTTPAHQSFLSNFNNSTTGKFIGYTWSFATFPVFVAAASAGSPTTSAWAPNSWTQVLTYLDVSSVAHIQLALYNASGGSLTTYCSKYYVLLETAI